MSGCAFEDGALIAWTVTEGLGKVTGLRSINWQLQDSHGCDVQLRKETGLGMRVLKVSSLTFYHVKLTYFESNTYVNINACLPTALATPGFVFILFLLV